MGGPRAHSLRRLGVCCCVHKFSLAMTAQLCVPARSATSRSATAACLQGWEVRQHEGRLLYIDHNSKATQWTPPPEAAAAAAAAAASATAAMAAGSNARPGGRPLSARRVMESASGVLAKLQQRSMASPGSSGSPSPGKGTPLQSLERRSSPPRVHQGEGGHYWGRTGSSGSLGGGAVPHAASAPDVSVASSRATTGGSEVPGSPGAEERVRAASQAELLVAMRTTTGRWLGRGQSGVFTAKGTSRRNGWAGQAGRLAQVALPRRAVPTLRSCPGTKLLPLRLCRTPAGPGPSLTMTSTMCGTGCTEMQVRPAGIFERQARGACDGCLPGGCRAAGSAWCPCACAPLPFPPSMVLAVGDYVEMFRVHGDIHSFLYTGSPAMHSHVLSLVVQVGTLLCMLPCPARLHADLHATCSVLPASHDMHGTLTCSAIPAEQHVQEGLRPYAQRGHSLLAPRPCRAARGMGQPAAWASCRTCGSRCSAAGTTPSPTSAGSRWALLGRGAVRLLLPKACADERMMCNPFFLPSHHNKGMMCFIPSRQGDNVRFFLFPFLSPCPGARPWSCSWGCASMTAAIRRATSQACRQVPPVPLLPPHAALGGIACCTAARPAGRRPLRGRLVSVLRPWQTRFCLQLATVLSLASLAHPVYCRTCRWPIETPLMRSWAEWSLLRPPRCRPHTPAMPLRAPAQARWRRARLPPMQRRQRQARRHLQPCERTSWQMTT